MASYMTTTEKLKHPVAAVKEMMGKGHGHNTQETHNEHGVLGRHNEHPVGGTTRTTPFNTTNEEQLSNEAGGLGGTPTLGTTAGTGARPVFSETGTAVDPHAHHTGHHAGAGIGGATATGLGTYEAEKHLGHQGHQTGHHVGTGAAGTGIGGVGAYEAEKHLGQHGQHQTGHHMGTGVGGAGLGGVGAHEAERHQGQHGQHQTGHHMGTGVGGAGLGGVGGYEAERHLGQHGHHQTGYTGTGVGGVGAYEAEQHLGHHNRHNDADLLAGQPGLPGTTGTRGEVYTPHDQRPRNVGLNVIGMDTPLNTSDYRSYPTQTAQHAPQIHTPSNINEERLEKTSLPANPLMSALTGGKIPPSIHRGVEQAGLTNETGGVNTGTHAHGAHHTGGQTGAYDTTRAGNSDVI